MNEPIPALRYEVAGIALMRRSRKCGCLGRCALCGGGGGGGGRAAAAGGVAGRPVSDEVTALAEAANRNGLATE